MRDNDAVAVAREAVTRRAKNTETLLGRAPAKRLDDRRRRLLRGCALEVALRDGAAGSGRADVSSAQNDAGA